MDKNIIKHDIEFKYQDEAHVLELKYDQVWIDVFLDELPLIMVKGFDKADLYIYSRLCEHFTRYIILRSDYQVHAQFKKDIKPIIYKAIEELNEKINNARSSS